MLRHFCWPEAERLVAICEYSGRTRNGKWKWHSKWNFMHSFNFISSRYDHLSKVLTRVLDERPSDVLDIFEDVSKEQKRAQFVSTVDTVQDKIDKTTEVALCQIQEKLFKVGLHIQYTPINLKICLVNLFFWSCSRKEMERRRLKHKRRTLTHRYPIWWSLVFTLNKLVLGSIEKNATECG